MFYRFGGDLNVYWGPDMGAGSVKIWDGAFLNFSVGFSFGSNDGRYEDYIYQKAEYDYYMDKYQTTFDNYKEFVPGAVK